MNVAALLFVLAFPSPRPHLQVADVKLERQGKAVLTALKGRKYAALAKLVHPRGLRFSPYGSLAHDNVVMPVKHVYYLPKPNKKVLWGEYEASGEPIRLTFPEYYREFIWTRDFTKAPKVAHQKYLGRGNRVLNMERFHPNGHWIEYHFPNSKNMLNWQSLRLVFETYNRELKLVAIVHDEWGT